MARFSKRHYEDVARIFRNYRPPAKVNDRQADIMLEDMVNMFAAMFRSDNSKFDNDRFAKACGI